MTKALLFKWTAFRCLKVCLVLIFLCSILSAQAYINLNEKISVSVKNRPIKDVLKQITEQSGFQFTYSNDLFDENTIITINSFNEKLDVVLDKLFYGSKYRWEAKGCIIAVKSSRSVLAFEKSDKNANDSLITLAGRVVDDKGHPISGVTISVKGTSIGTLTNNNGQFILKGIPQNSYISFTSIGFLGRQLKAAMGQQEWDAIVLKEAVNDLDAAVVQAYTITSKRYSTSSISTLSAKEIEKKPVTNVLLALQAEVPGIIIQQTAGTANAGIKVQIRGLNSLSKGNDPLYVVDGVPYTSQLMETVNYTNLGLSGDASKPEFAKPGNPLSFINPADIESVSVLKDADATSIYGSRAAAGAIIITTKKGVAGPTKFNINVQNGWGKVSKFVPLLNTDQYLAVRREAKSNTNEAIFSSDYDLNGTWDTTRSIDWQKVLLGRTANYSDYQISSSGGTENTKFLVGIGFHRETTVFLTDAINKKGSLHFNISNTSSNKKFAIQFSGSYMADKNTLPASNLTSKATTLPPVAPSLYNNDGTLNWGFTTSGESSWTNPLASASLKGTTATKNLVGSMLLSYKIIPGLSIKSNFGYTYMQIDETRVTPLVVYAPDVRQYYQRTSNYSNGSIKSWIIEPQLSYDVNIGKGRLQALIGSTLQYKNNNQQLVTGSGYNSDLLLLDIRSAATVTANSTTATTYKYNALFGLINYRFNNRYIINFSARRDGSSRFGSNNLFHNFGSVGAAWIFSEEPFFSKLFPFVSFGKLQSSYGTTGNDQIGDYKFLNLYYSQSTTIPYQGISGLNTLGLPNPNLQWEETKKMQFSLDLGVLNDRILVNATYFRNRSSNQLSGYTLPFITGFNSYTRNLPATVQNMGWELSLNADMIKWRGGSWSTRLNMYIPRNKLIAFPGLSSSSYASQYIVGKPITSKKVLRYAGLNSETGLYQFFDYKGNLTSNPDYNTDQVLMNTNPTYSGGISNTLRYKGFQFDVLIQYYKQYVQGMKYGQDLPGVRVNQPRSILNRWRSKGDKSEIQKYYTSFDDSTYTAFAAITGSDINNVNCNVFRVKNVSLSWRFPDNWCHRTKIQNGQLFIHAENLFTFSNFWGADPETGLSGNLPPLRIITIGLQTSF